MTHDTNPPPKAFGAFAAELCATLIARNPLLAMLLKPFLDYFQRTMAAVETLLAALRAGQFTPPSTQAPSAPAPAARSTARPTSVPAPRIVAPPIAAPRVILRRPRQPRAPDAASSPSAPRPPIITRHRPRFTPANTPPASFRFFAPSQHPGRCAAILLR